jgi:hypothetical protein
MKAMNGEGANQLVRLDNARFQYVLNDVRYKKKGADEGTS